MKFDRRTFRPLVTFAAGLFVLVACQNATEPNTSPDGSLLVTARYSMATASRIPDSVVWTGPKNNGFQEPSCKQDLSCSDTFRISAPLGNDFISVQLWTLGIRSSTLSFSEQGSSTTLNLVNSVERDSLDIALLSRYFALPDSIKTKYGSLSAGLVFYYAKLLLAADPEVKGEPLPIGMNQDSIKTALVYLNRGKTTDQLVALNLNVSLNLDTSFIRKAVSFLITKKLLGTTDSVALFPPPPVWVKSALIVADSLTQGGSAVVVKGAFAWNNGHNVKPVIQVRTAKPGDAVNFLFPTEKFLPTDTTWDLNGNLSIQATSQAAPGIDTLVVTLSDGKGNSAASQSLFYVKPAKDTTGPAIHWVVPSASIGVDATVSSYKVQVMATDPSGVDSVYIQGVSAHNDSGSYWSSSVALGAATGKPMTLVAKAWDKNKNPSLDSSISLTRSVPTGTDKPTLAIQQPSSSTNNTLPYDSATLHLVYKITDYLVPVDTTSVKFGTVVPKRLTDSTWAADVPVPATGSPISILVQVANKNGSGSSENVVVTRAADLTPPSLTITSPSKDTSVAYGTASIIVATAASDAASGLKSVTVGGKPVDASGKATVPLITGANLILAIATDNAGNADTVKLNVNVGVDVTPPSLTLTSPSKDTSVAYGTASIAVTTAASDAGSGLRSVTVGGKAVDASGKATVPLSAGANLILAIATDVVGNADTVKLNVSVAADTVGPTLVITSPVDGASLAYGTTSVQVTATATDAVSGLASITIGSTVCIATPCTANFTLGSDNKVTVTAKDNAGLATSKFVTVKIAADMTGPILAITSPASGAAFPYGTTSVPVTATASDAASGLASITIGSTVCIASPCTANFALGSDNKVTVTAKDNANNATTATVSVVVMGLAAMPTFNPPANTYTSAQQVSLSSAMNGATIYYTLDGSTPTTTHSTKYLIGAPINVSASETIRAFAMAAGYTNSQVAIGAYTINYDATLKSLKVGNKFVTIPSGGGAALTTDSLDGLSKQVAITAIANDPAATVKINGGTSGILSVINDSLTVNIVVTNGNATQTYRLKLSARHIGTFTDGRDNQTYNAVKIGDQWWMAQNMNFGASTGSPDTIGTCYNGINAGCAINGRLYGTGTGVCPVGWHVPSTDEWSILSNAVGGDAVAGKVLKSSSWDGTDAFHFNVFPAGYTIMGSYQSQGSFTAFWTNTASTGVGFSTGDDALTLSYGGFSRSTISVRCVAD